MAVFLAAFVKYPPSSSVYTSPTVLAALPHSISTFENTRAVQFVVFGDTTQRLITSLLDVQISKS